uniref:Integrase catalytic domain-containing protein n=1 Tax=Tanacetum cinerariifolium TaxID=118510 RepID=A0A6L2MEU1_TANCI|nr:hypothetical protein [Tanacetum cinerariifolium]
MFVIEQPISPAPAADFAENVLADWNAVYDAHNEVAYLMFGSMTLELHRQFENYAPYEMLQEEGKPVAAYVLKIKRYVDQLKRLGYVLPQDLTVGLILNGLTKDFAGFVRNHNMHNMEKTIGELHAMLIEYEKGKGKANGKGKDKQVYIPKPKNLKPTTKEHPAKDAPATTAKRHVSRQGASYFITFVDDYSRYGYVYLLKHKHEVFEKFKVFKNEVENQLQKTIKGLRSDRGSEYISQEFKDYLKTYGIFQQLNPPYTPQHNESATRILNMVPTKKRDTADKLQQRSVKCIFIGYPKETMGYYFYILPENKIVVSRYAEFFEKNLITQEVSGRP